MKKSENQKDTSNENYQLNGDQSPQLDENIV